MPAPNLTDLWKGLVPQDLPCQLLQLRVPDAVFLGGVLNRLLCLLSRRAGATEGPVLACSPSLVCIPFTDFSDLVFYAPCGTLHLFQCLGYLVPDFPFRLDRNLIFGDVSEDQELKELARKVLGNKTLPEISEVRGWHPIPLEE
jgi:hypothetical protein